MDNLSGACAILKSDACRLHDRTGWDEAEGCYYGRGRHQIARYSMCAIVNSTPERLRRAERCLDYLMPMQAKPGSFRAMTRDGKLNGDTFGRQKDDAAKACLGHRFPGN